jgi:pyrroline-5-carboxylate reductase
MGLRVGFVGAGQMAEAIVRGIIRGGVAEPADIFVSDVMQPRLDFMAAELQVNVTTDNSELFKKANVIVLCVKPQIISKVMADAGSLVTDHLVISIAAGTPITFFSSALPAGTRIVRVMPNTPCLVGETAAAYALGATATDADAAVTEAIITGGGKGGKIYRLGSEALLDAVTGLSGSGPAYAYMFIEGALTSALHR